MKTILYLSPHLDDVVFSCSSHLMTQASHGHRTIVATVFTEGDHEARKLEDLAAMKVCGAEAQWLGYLDAPYRNKKYNSFASITQAEPDDFSLDLSDLVKTIQPDQIIAPLAVGTHIDHLLVHEAVARLEFNNTWYYEDRPYSLTHGATELRLRQLGYESNLTSFEEFWASFKMTYYVQRLLHTSEKSLVCEKFRQIWQSPKGEKKLTSINIKSSKNSAIYCYKSQLSHFIQREEVSLNERLLKLDSKI